MAVRKKKKKRICKDGRKWYFYTWLYYAVRFEIRRIDSDRNLTTCPVASFHPRNQHPPTFNDRSFTNPFRDRPELQSPIAFAPYGADFRLATSVSRNVNADASASLTNLMLSIRYSQSTG